MGQLTSSTSAFVTVDNTDLSSAKDVSVGSDFTCALDGTGSPWCWGRGKKGRLGNGIGSNPDKATPYAVSTTTVFATIESGKAHTCALTSTGAIECWGDNTLGQNEDPIWTQFIEEDLKNSTVILLMSLLGLFSQGQILVLNQTLPLLYLITDLLRFGVHTMELSTMITSLSIVV